MGRWSHFSHEADIGLYGEGTTLEEAFVMIATALTAVVTQPESVRAVTRVTVRCKAPSLDVLLLDWLNCIIYEMAVRNMLFSCFSVTIKDLVLTADLLGETVDRRRHEPAVEPKGATFTELSVKKVEGGWQLRCVIDV